MSNHNREIYTDSRFPLHDPNQEIKAVINPESFLIEDIDDASFIKWLKAQGLDDPEKMFDVACSLVLQKYENAKKVEFLNEFHKDGITFYRFKITNYNGKEYIQGSWQLLRGF